jgi:hypothetical protein
VSATFPVPPSWNSEMVLALTLPRLIIGLDLKLTALPLELAFAITGFSPGAPRGCSASLRAWCWRCRSSCPVCPGR